MTKFEQTRINLLRALESLEESVATPPRENRDYAGIIQNFEFVYELTWKTLKLYLESQGIDSPFPRVVFENAHKSGLVAGNEVWKEIMEARNISTHTYDHELAVNLVQKIKDQYLSVFKATGEKIRGL